MCNYLKITNKYNRMWYSQAVAAQDSCTLVQCINQSHWNLFQFVYTISPVSYLLCIKPCSDFIKHSTLSTENVTGSPYSFNIKCQISFMLWVSLGAIKYELTTLYQSCKAIFTDTWLSQQHIILLYTVMLLKNIAYSM